VQSEQPATEVSEFKSPRVIKNTGVMDNEEESRKKEEEASRTRNAEKAK
jgi:hypothetical protein